jgi:hypothetical protein
MTVWNKFIAALAAALGIATVGVTAFRMLFAVDFTDEALYAVMPYRFALGAKPFVDEKLFQQTAAFISYPFVKVFYLLTGGTTGIILYMRFLSLFLMVGVALCAWLAIRRLVGRSVALIAVLPCLAFVYFNIPSLTYNTLGLGFLAIGCFLGYLGGTTGRRRWLVMAGAAHGLACVAYPSLAAAIAVFGISLVVLSIKDRDRLRQLGHYILGGSVVAVLLLLLFYLAGFANVADSFRGTASTGIFGGGAAKLTAIFLTFWRSYQGKVLLAIGLVATLLLKKRLPSAAGFLLLAVPVVPLFATGFTGFLQSSGYVAYYSLLAPFLLIFVRGDKGLERLFWLVWVPGFAAGLATSFTSSNGFWAAAIGLFPGFIVTSVYFVRALAKLWASRPDVSRAVGAIALVIPVVALLFYQFGLPYRDDSIRSLTARVPSGPYAGLRTTPQKSAYLAKVTRALETAGAGANTVFIFDNFPAGYLVTSLTPLTDKAWVAPARYYPGVNRKTTVDRFRAGGRYPDLILRLKSLFYETAYSEPLSYAPDDPLSRLAQGARYKLVVDQPEYSIYRRR